MWTAPSPTRAARAGWRTVIARDADAALAAKADRVEEWNKILSA